MKPRVNVYALPKYTEHVFGVKVLTTRGAVPAAHVAALLYVDRVNWPVGSVGSVAT
jgi:hypothetical protein